MALSDYYSIYDLSNKNKNEKNEDEYNSFFNYMIGKNEVTKINEKNLLKKEKELNFQNFIGDERDRKIPRKKEEVENSRETPLHSLDSTLCRPPHGAKRQVGD